MHSLIEGHCHQCGNTFLRSAWLLRKLKTQKYFTRNIFFEKKKIKSFLKDAEHFSVSSALTPVYLLVEVCII